MAYTPAENIKSEPSKPILKLDLPKGVDTYLTKSNSAWDLEDSIGIAFKVKQKHSEEAMKHTLLYLAEILESAAKQIREQYE